MSAIIPAILPKTRADLDRTLASCARIPGVDAIQIDVVDGRFAGPASWPYDQASEVGLPAREIEDALAPYLGRLILDIDLMVVDPEPVIGLWLEAGARRLTLHFESLTDPGRTIAAIKRRYGHNGDTDVRLFEIGLAVNIATDLARLEPYLPDVDYVQLMGIAHIGRQREPFEPRVLARVRELSAHHPDLLIQVDGGVSPENAAALTQAGAARLVAGHAVVGAADQGGAWRELEALAHQPLRASEERRSISYTDAMALTDTDVAALEDKAREVRETIIEMLVAARSGHTAGPLDMADIFTAFYFHILRHDPHHPDWPERDRLILSNGHIVPVRYAAMAHAGYFPVEECLTLRKFGSRLQGHPERLRLPGLETTSGPLGEGLAQAAGIAYGLRMDGRTERVYCLMSDGEQQEGNTWEAAMFAGKYKLQNLTAVMDRNNIQIDGMTEDVMPLEPLADKYRSFGWHVLECSGHDMRAFIAAVEEAKAIYEKPTVILAHTIPGKGVKEIEFDYRWHGVPPGAGPEDVWKKAEQGKAMLRELRTLGGRIQSEHE